MNILFLSLLDFDSIEESNIYTDLLREFKANGHGIYIISPVERRKNERTRIVVNDGVVILKQKILNIQKTSFIEKGISTLLLDPLLILAVRYYFKNIHFDLVLYATPPVTFERVISFIKKRDGASTYLMLKDIFPQNAVDMRLLTTTGWRGVLLKYFVSKERKLYAISDKIGCMSEANCEYILSNNPWMDESKVEICPNAIDIRKKHTISLDKKYELRSKFRLPLDSVIFIYGGNLGLPQGVDFIVNCLNKQINIPNRYFIIIGNGTEYDKLARFIKEMRPNNIELRKAMPKIEYEELLSCCDVGLIFLDYKFTIPNFPSRILSYMQLGKPVLAATDVATDIGSVIENRGFGWWCPSNDVDKWTAVVNDICSETKEKLVELGNNAYQYLKERYDVKYCYKIIMKSVSN